MATELCKYIINKGTDPLSRVDGGVIFECLTSISHADPSLEGPGNEELAEGFYFLCQ